MKEDVQKTWEDRLSRAKKKRKEWSDQFKIELGRAYFEGQQNPGYPPEEWITINKIYSHLQAQLPLLYSMDPYFYVKLKKSFQVDPQAIGQMELRGKGRQAMLNYLKSELDLKPKARLGIQDAHFAYGVLKVRRASDSKKHPHAGEPIKDDEGNELKDETTGESIVFPDTLPVNERYELCRVHPDDILLDEDAGPLEDSWGWIGQHSTISKAEALEDPRFNKKAVKAAQGRERADAKKVSTIERISQIFGKKDDETFLDVWEIYDLKKREFLIFCEDAEDLFQKPRSTPAGIEKHPYSFLRFTLRDNSPYPIPPVSPSLDQQKEYNLLRSRRVTHRKRFNRKYEVNTNMLIDPDTALAKLESGGDGTHIEVQQIGAVRAIEDAPLDQQDFQETVMLNNDLVETFGTPNAARGIASSDSATEASILDKRLEVREGDRLSMVVDWLLDCWEKMDLLVQTHIDKDEAVKVIGPQGEFWQPVKQTDYDKIEGEYEYSVNLGASQPRLPDIERSQWIAFMSQVVIPFPHILTMPSMMKRMAEMFHIEDDAALDELRQMGLKMLSGIAPMPGEQGGGSPTNPVAAIMGSALGPMGGNTNGGGSPMAKQ